MRPDIDLLHVAHPNQRNTQQTPPSTQQATQQPCNKTQQSNLKALADRVLSSAERNSARNNSATTPVASRNFQPGVVQHDATNPDARREKVLALLRASAGARLAFVVNDDTTDPVTVSIAIRDAEKVVTCEVEIPRARYDGFRMLELADKWGNSPAVSRELAVIDGGKTERLTPEPEAA